MGRSARPVAATRLLIPAFGDPPLEAAGTRHSLYGEAMGTVWSAHLYGPPDAAPIRARIEALLDGVIAEMSSWSPLAFLMRFNAAPAGTWLEAPAGFRRVLAEAVRIAALTGGAFNPAAGALVDLWGFGPASRHDAPEAGDVAAAARTAGRWRALAVENTSVLQPGLALDFSGIAKGYAVDLVAACLREAGAPSFLVDIGGELYGQGVKDDAMPWWVELE
ncbi:MAG: FAD:protein FMN transferase, partial [Alphaproteobacteria bacterium]|nr:FAD:protein FMN transferase [Alphaproteobacteria bacterium]